MSPHAKAGLTALLSFALCAAAISVKALSPATGEGPQAAGAPGAGGPGGPAAFTPRPRAAVKGTLPVLRAAVREAAQRALPAAQAGAAPPTEVAARAAAPALPESLQGTAPDGALRVDGAGRLIRDLGLRRFFDYFLSASGELPPEALRARVLAEASERASSAAAAEALALFDRYRAAPDHSAAAALFPDEPARAPADREAARRALTAPSRLDEEEEAMRAAGASDDDLFAARAQTSGSAAASRLAALDRDRARFTARLREFDGRKQALAAAEPDRAARREREQRLLAELFTSAEQVRVRALRSDPGH